MTAPLDPAQHAVIAAEAGSRLESLAEMYCQLKPEADRVRARLDEITNAIKRELTEAAPGAHKVDLSAAGLDAPLRLSARTSWRLDTARLKTEEPELYVRYARQTSYWDLRTVTGPS